MHERTEISCETPLLTHEAFCSKNESYFKPELIGNKRENGNK